MSATGAGALLNAAGMYTNVSAERKTAKANAAYTDLQAADAASRGSIAERDRRTETTVRKGRARNAFAANGVDLSTGSPVDVVNSIEATGEQDVRTIRENTRREVTGFRMQGANYRAVAGSMNPWLSAGASALGGAGLVADRWYSYRNAGGGKKKK